MVNKHFVPIDYFQKAVQLIIHKFINETMGIWRSFVLVIDKQGDVLKSYGSHMERSRRVSWLFKNQEHRSQVKFDLLKRHFTI